MNWLKQKLLWLKAELRYRLTGKKYSVILSEQVKRQLEQASEEDREAILEAIEALSKNPYVGKRIYKGEEGYEEPEDS